MADGGIVCKKVTKKYGHLKALKGIDLEIKQGDFLTLFGPNGAGKTTLMKILCGLIRPSTGSAYVSGHDVHEEDVRAKVGVISHNSFLYRDLTALENVTFFADLYGVENPGRKAEELLRQVELHERKDDLARTFSRGMTQRLSIARALVADPDFIFLDEPFSGLDVHSATLFRDLLVQLHQKGKTVMMITHDIGIGLSVATHTAILKAGKMVHYDGTGGKTAADLKNLYIEKVGL